MVTCVRTHAEYKTVGVRCSASDDQLGKTDHKYAAKGGLGSKVEGHDEYHGEYRRANEVIHRPGLEHEDGREKRHTCDCTQSDSERERDPTGGECSAESNDQSESDESEQ